MNTLNRGVAALLVCLAGATLAVQGAEREETVADTIGRVKRSNLGPRLRVQAIDKLGEIADGAVLRDYRVVEELVALVNEKTTDMFVRIAAIKALGRITFNYPQATDKFLAGFITIIKDPTAHGMT